MGTDREYSGSEKFRSDYKMTRTRIKLYILYIIFVWSASIAFGVLGRFIVLARLEAHSDSYYSLLLSFYQNVRGITLVATFIVVPFYIVLFVAYEIHLKYKNQNSKAETPE